MRKILILLVVVGLFGVFGIGKVEAFNVDDLAREVTEDGLGHCRVFDGMPEAPSYMAIITDAKTADMGLTPLYGNFQVVMRKLGIVDGRGVEAIRQASYGIITRNIAMYVGDSVDRATLLRAAIFEVEGTEGKKDELLNIGLLLTRGAKYIGGRPYSNSSVFGVFATAYMFSKEIETDIKQKYRANYYPDTKKQLIRALAVGDFRTVDRLLSRAEIRKARDIWKAICDRAFEMRGGKKSTLEDEPRDAFFRETIEGMAEIAKEDKIRECRIFDGIEETTSHFLIMADIKASDERFTALVGNFQVVMRELGIVDGRGVEEMRQASYGIITRNIAMYVGDSVERATLMKTAILEPERPDGKKDELLNGVWVSDVGSAYRGSKPYKNNSHFGFVATSYLFEAKHEREIKRLDPLLGFYPATKKELIRALAVGDFRTVDRLVNREEIRKARDIWKAICDRAIEMQGGRR